MQTTTTNTTSYTLVQFNTINDFTLDFTIVNDSNDERTLILEKVTGEDRFITFKLFLNGISDTHNIVILNGAIDSEWCKMLEMNYIDKRGYWSNCGDKGPIEPSTLKIDESLSPYPKGESNHLKMCEALLFDKTNNKRGTVLYSGTSVSKTIYELWFDNSVLRTLVQLMFSEGDTAFVGNIKRLEGVFPMVGDSDAKRQWYLNEVSGTRFLRCRAEWELEYYANQLELGSIDKLPWE